LVSLSEKAFVTLAERTIPFFSEDFKNVVDKSNLSLPGQNIVQSGTIFGRDSIFR
jgi:hypothetical protein